MPKNLYWGIAALIVILIAAGGFIYWQWSQVQQLKEQFAQDEKMREEKNKPIADNLPPARPGFKWVPHGDHYHEVPISAPDAWQEAPIAGAPDSPQQQSEVVPPSVEVHYSMPDKPVEALREYMEKRGHWSAKWIPDFPPEDTEAARMAHNVLIMLIHEEAGNEIMDGPAGVAADEYFQTLGRYRSSTDQRRFDILKLSWPFLDAPLGGDPNKMFFGR